MSPFKLKMFPRRLVRKKLVDMAGNTTNEYRWVISRAWTLFGIRLMWKQEGRYLSFGYDENNRILLSWHDYPFYDNLFPSEAAAHNFIQDIIDNPSKYYTNRFVSSLLASSALTATDVKQLLERISNLAKDHFNDIL